MKFTTPVTPGQGRGKTLGFPTFNLHVPRRFTHKHGIYAGYVWLNGQKYLGAFHLGPIPVFKDSTLHLEVFILDYHSDAPVSQLTFQLVKYLRPIKNFPTPTALAHQISRDVSKTREFLS